MVQHLPQSWEQQEYECLEDLANGTANSEWPMRWSTKLFQVDDATSQCVLNVLETIDNDFNLTRFNYPRSMTSRGPSDHCRAPVPIMIASDLSGFRDKPYKYNTIHWRSRSASQRRYSCWRLKRWWLVEYVTLHYLAYFFYVSIHWKAIADYQVWSLVAWRERP